MISIVLGAGAKSIKMDSVKGETSKSVPCAVVLSPQGKSRELSGCTERCTPRSGCSEKAVSHRQVRFEGQVGICQEGGHGGWRVLCYIVGG